LGIQSWLVLFLTILTMPTKQMRVEKIAKLLNLLESVNLEKEWLFRVGKPLLLLLLPRTLDLVPLETRIMAKYRAV
jgi:hypothetical protein